MVVTNDFRIWELLKCLRAHGWSRELSSHDSDDLDHRFHFVNLGYNLRPMEVQAAMGRVQLEKLDALNANRNANYLRVIERVESDPDIPLACVKAEPGCGPAWFALPFLMPAGLDRATYLAALEARGVETRPVVTGNFARQPAVG